MNPTSTLHSSTLATILLVTTTFFWGVTFTVVKDAVSRVDLFLFLSQRFLLSALVMIVPGLFLKGIPDRESIRSGAILGTVLFISYALQTAALLSTSASNTAFLSGIHVVLVPLLAGFLFRQTVGRQAATGAFLALIGLHLLCTDGRFGFNRGDLLAVSSAFGIGLHILLTDRYARRHDVFWVTAIQLSTIALLSIVIATGKGERVFVWHPFLFWPLVICSLCATVFAFWVQTSVQRFIPPVRTAVIFCLEPLFAALYAAVAAGERLTVTGWIGASLILTGMIVTGVTVEREGS